MINPFRRPKTTAEVVDHYERELATTREEHRREVAAWKALVEARGAPERFGWQEKLRFFFAINAGVAIGAGRTGVAIGIGVAMFLTGIAFAVRRGLR